MSHGNIHITARPCGSRAKELFFVTFGRLMLNSLNLNAFHSTIAKSLESGKPLVQREWEEKAKGAIASEEAKRWFDGRDDFHSEQFGMNIFKVLTERSFRAARQTLDSATLIFAHTLLDEALSDCCQISFLADPADWYRFVAKKTVELGAIQLGDPAEVTRAAAWKYVRGLGRESIKSRVERLHQVCVPRLNKLPSPTAWIKSEDIERFDNLRHAVVHSKAFSKQVPNVENLAGFAKQAGMSALLLVSQAHNLLSEPPPEFSYRRGLRWLALAKREFPEFVELITYYAEKQQGSSLLSLATQNQRAE